MDLSKGIKAGIFIDKFNSLHYMHHPTSVNCCIKTDIEGNRFNLWDRCFTLFFQSWRKHFYEFATQSASKTPKLPFLRNASNYRSIQIYSQTSQGVFLLSKRAFLRSKGRVPKYFPGASLPGPITTYPLPSLHLDGWCNLCTYGNNITMERVYRCKILDPFAHWILSLPRQKMQYCLCIFPKLLSPLLS